MKAARADELANTPFPEPASQPTTNGRSSDPRPRRGGQNTTAAISNRLLERNEEMSEIRHLLGGSWEHSKCPIVIEGQVGTGKTALLNSTLEMGREVGLRIGRARCDSAETSASFGVVRQLFSSMFGHPGIPDGPVNDGTDLARRVLRGGLSPADDTVDAYHSLLLLLETTGDEAALLGVDDVQWADAASASWLQFLARRLTTSSVHLVMTTRAGRAGAATASDPLVSNPSTRRFVMHPLGMESTRAMMTQHLGADFSQHVATRAHRVTGGNPLLIARMLTALDDCSDSPNHITEHQIANLASPVVARFVMSLVATLPDGTQSLLEAAAVLGEADLRVAATVAGIGYDDAGRLADVLADVGLLGWERPLDFRHLFERNSVYSVIQPGRRAQLHAHAAQVLSDLGASAGAIAKHLMESDPSGDEWTATVLVEAARRDLELGDAEFAAKLLERADREAPASPLRADIARLRAEVDGNLGRDTAVEHLGRAARLGLNPVALAETALDLLDQEREHTTCAAILEMVLPARDELVVHHPHLGLRLHLAESVLLPASALLERRGSAIELEAELASTTTARLLGIQRALRSAVRLEGTHQQLIDTLRPLLTPELLRAGGLVQTTIVAAALSALVRVGAYGTADPLLRTAMGEAEGAGRRLDVAAYTVVLAESLAMQGRVVAAEQALAGANCDAQDVVSQCAAMQTRFYATLRERGNREPVRVSVVPTALAPGLAKLGASPGMFLTEMTARMQLLEGEWLNALTSFDRLGIAAERSAVRNPAFSPWRIGRGAALAGLGRTREGAALAAENLELARAFGCPITIAEGLECAARFQSAEAQIPLLHEAVGLVAGTKAELLRCNLLIDLGLARHYAGDAVAARTAFRDGADHATRLGFTRLAGLAGRGLLACGARPRRLQTSGLESLTPAELRVVKLAADGNTNGSIATSLYINLKTVESHLTRSYRKLGVAVRAELKAALEASESGHNALVVPEAG